MKSPSYPARGRSQVAHTIAIEQPINHIAAIFDHWPDLRFRSRRRYTGENFVVSEWTATATDLEGRRLEWDGIDVFPFRGLLIARKDVYSSAKTARILTG